MIASIIRREALSARSGLRSCAAQNIASSTGSVSRRFAAAHPIGGQGSRRSSQVRASPGYYGCQVRSFSLTEVRSNGSGRTTVKDPEPQTGLYYHPTQISISRGADQPTSTVDGWVMSFLSKPSASEDAIIAYVLPTNTSSSQDSEPADFVRANPDRIRINPAGWKIMHEVLKTQVVPNDDLLKFEASTRESGWAHLTDLRHPLMPGRIATPENIIASVAFTEGEINVESYEENKSYRLVTGYEGPIQMADSWLEKLRERFGSL